MSRATLGQIARLFLRLGFTAFGGPAVHVAIMEDEVVRRRGWMTEERFLDLLGAANLMPGPSSTELAIFIGYDQCGWAGWALSGVCFIAPAAGMVTLLAWAYLRFGAIPQTAAILYGIKPVVIAVVVHAVWGLGPKAVKGSLWLAGLGGVAFAASLLGVDALAVLLGAGAAAALRRRLTNSGAPPAAWLLGGIAGGGASLSAPVSLTKVFLSFSKIGAFVFGSGYVLLAFLRADLVDRLHWMTEQQLLDAVAIGQVTPGPVFTTATFIGYLLAGPWGALVATVGIFLPGFALGLASRPVVARLRRSAAASAFLDGVNVAALGLMAAVTVTLARAAIVDVVAGAIACASAVLLLRYRWNTTWLVLGGALVGVLARVVGLPR